MSVDEQELLRLYDRLIALLELKEALDPVRGMLRFFICAPLCWLVFLDDMEKIVNLCVAGVACVALVSVVHAVILCFEAYLRRVIEKKKRLCERRSR